MVECYLPKVEMRVQFSYPAPYLNLSSMNSMSTPIALNALLSLPSDFTDEVEVGGSYTVVKTGYRITPYLMPMELSTHDHVYVGKIVVTKLLIENQVTEITFKVLKLFTEEESQTFTDNFIRI